MKKTSRGNKFSYVLNGFALRFGLKQQPKATWKWPIGTGGENQHRR